MGRNADRIKTASPSRLVGIADDFIKEKCEQCSEEKEDVKDAKASLKDYIAGIRAQLIALGVIGGVGVAGKGGWKALLTSLFELGIGGAIALVIAGLLAIWWLYEVYSEIAKRVKALREALNKLDDCLDQHCRP